MDFILYGEQGFWAIEVKNNRNVAPDDIRGLHHFIEDYPQSKPLLLYRGPKMMYKNVLCLPVEQFLKQLRPNFPLGE